MAFVETAHIISIWIQLFNRLSLFNYAQLNVTAGLNFIIHGFIHSLMQFNAAVLKILI